MKFLALAFIALTLSSPAFAKMTNYRNCIEFLQKEIDSEYRIASVWRVQSDGEFVFDKEAMEFLKTQEGRQYYRDTTFEFEKSDKLFRFTTRSKSNASEYTEFRAIHDSNSDLAKVEVINTRDKRKDLYRFRDAKGTCQVEDGVRTHADGREEKLFDVSLCLSLARFFDRKPEALACHCGTAETDQSLSKLLDRHNAEKEVKIHRQTNYGAMGHKSLVVPQGVTGAAMHHLSRCWNRDSLFYTMIEASQARSGRASAEDATAKGTGERGE